MDIFDLCPTIVARLECATGFTLIALASEAVEQDLSIDLQIKRRADGRFVLGVIFHEEERIEHEAEFVLGLLADTGNPDVQAGVLLAWVATIQVAIRRSQARVARLLAAGRT